MSVFKLFKGKSKSKAKTNTNNSHYEPTAEEQAELKLPINITDKEGSKKKSGFSISRSGRFKAKKRDRAVLDAEFYSTHPSESMNTNPTGAAAGPGPSSESAGHSRHGSQGASSGGQRGSHGKGKPGSQHSKNGSYSRSSCRDLEQQMAARYGHSSGMPPQTTVL